MKLRLASYLLFFITLSCSSIVHARWGISIARGNGTNKIQAYRLNLQNAWDYDCWTANNKKVSGYWELAFTKMIANQVFIWPTNKHLQALSASGTIRLKQIFKSVVYVDIGLGAAYLTEDKIAARELGSNLLFEDRLGIGVLLGKKQQFELGYRLVHYSNAYLAQKNNGLNLHLFILGYWFN